MSLSDLAFAVGALVASFLVSACPAPDEERHVGELQAASQGCTVAEIAGVEVRWEQVALIQAAIQPTPEKEAARRLLVDAALAHVANGGSLADSDAQEWLRAYRELHAESLREATGSERAVDVVRRRLQTAKVDYNFKGGTCPVSDQRT